MNAGSLDNYRMPIVLLGIKPLKSGKDLEKEPQSNKKIVAKLEEKTLLSYHTLVTTIILMEDVR